MISPDKGGISKTHYQYLESILDDFEDELHLEDIIPDRESYKSLNELMDHSAYIEKAKEISKEHSIGNFENIPEEYSYIAQFTGDDEVLLTDNHAMGMLMITIAQELLRLKISWKDVGQAKYLANYAEDWILLPIRDEMSFPFIQNYHKGDGIPYTLEMLKCKMLSPVRKQSSLELDLSSKMAYLGQSAKWTDKSWFTYDFHQVALILAMEVFDFSNEDKFPFLGKEEGGIGCWPPWNNHESLIGYLFSFDRGKSDAAIRGLFFETVRIYEGSLKPSQSFFMKALKASKVSKTFWKSYVETYKTLRMNGSLTELEIKDLISNSLDIDLPRDLADLAIDFEMEDFSISSIVFIIEKCWILNDRVGCKTLRSRH